MASSPTIEPGDAVRSDWTAYAPLDAGVIEQLQASGSDVIEGFRRHRAWRYLASEHIKNQYRRTVLGPWWLTAQTVVYVAGLGFVFSRINGAPIKTFLPYVAVGYLSFALLAGLTRSSANVFTNQAGVIKSTRQPLTSLVLRSVAIETIQFGHNVLILVAFFALRLIHLSPWLALAPVGLALILINGVAIGLWLGPAVARFRDVSPAVESILQVIVFFTPIFYPISIFKGKEKLLPYVNPYTYFVEFFRQSVLGRHPSTISVVGVVGFTLANLLVATAVFSRTRSRLPYWVA